MSATEKKGCLPKFLHRLLGLKDDSKTVLPYRLRDDFLSNAEASFMKALQLATEKRYLICPKVSLKDIFFVSGGKDSIVFHNKIARKHVDFLLCDNNTFKPKLGIELDDSSHKRADRTERDKFVNEVFKVSKLPLLRIPVKSNYDIQKLKIELNMTLELLSEESIEHIKPSDTENNEPKQKTPICPKCNVPMVLRTAKQVKNKGKQFFGCRNYPKCKEIADIVPAQKI